MYAILTAGGIPQPGEPLYEYTKGISKAMLDLCGKPMIQWVLDALDGAQTVEGILVVGLGPESGIISKKTLHFTPNQGGMMENILTGIRDLLKIYPSASHALVVSSDIPGITPEMVDWVVNAAMETDDDLYYNVIPRQVMEKRYPTSRRTYTRLKGMELCGGDMNVVRTLTATGNDAMWERIINSRKSPLKQASLLGFDLLILVLLHQITMERAVQKVSRRLGLKGRAVVCPYAEVGMDIDKPHQLELMRQDLARQVKA